MTQASAVLFLALIGMSLAFQWQSHPTIIELSARPYLYKLSRQTGRSITTLSQIPDSELDMFAANGIHAIYLMGVWSLGPFGLHRDQTDPDLIRGYAQVLPGYSTDDIIGSPFAITHFSCNSQLGSDADIGHLRDRLHARGIALILDFVPNHTAVDADWMTSNPDYYVHAAPGVTPPYDPNRYMTSGIAYGRDPYSGAWPDTAQLNYWNPDLRSAQTNNLLKIATLADGVRCDMAMLELNSIFSQTWGGELRPSKYPAPTSEFWRDAIRTVKAKYPSFVFLAETYWDGTVEALHACGFDFLYDKDGLYNQLQSGYLDNLRGYISNMNFTYMAHFVENHDEVRAIAGFGSPARADAAVAVAITLPGMRFYFDGQWEGKKNKLDVHLRRSADESVNVPVQQFYNKLLNITNAPVFHSGTWRYLSCSDVDGTSWRLMAWSWSMGSEKRLVVVNYSDTKGIARVRVPDVAGSGNVVIHELFSDETYTRSAPEMRDSGLVVVLEAWQTQIFAYP